MRCATWPFSGAITGLWSGRSLLRASGVLNASFARPTLPAIDDQQGARHATDGTVTRTIGGRHGARRTPDRWSTAKTRKAARKPANAEKRLRTGRLDGLVLDYLQKHAGTGPLGPAAVAKGLGRSSGAIANCLARLATTGVVRQVATKPRRYGVALRDKSGLALIRRANES